MKMKIVICLLLCCFYFHPASATPSYNFDQLKLGEKISLPGLPPNKVFYTLEKDLQDVTGSGTKDIILLVGEKDDSTSLLTKNVHIVFINTKTNKVQSTLLRKKASYSPKITFGDMDGDGVPEILNEFPSPEGQSKSYFLTSLKDGNLKIYNGSEGLSTYLMYSSKFEDNFVLQLRNSHLNITVPVTIYGYKNIYVADGIYNENGKLKDKTVKPSIQLINMQFEDKNKDGKVSLYADQLVQGLSGSNVIVGIKSQINLKDGKLTLTQIDVCGRMYSSE